MGVSLTRRRNRVDAFDREALRRWLTEAVADDVRLAGGPRPRLVVIGDDHFDTLDLVELMAAQPEAHVGATAVLLLTGQGVWAVYGVMRLVDDDGGEAAVLFELLPPDESATRGTWIAVLPFTVDADGVGSAADWRTTVALDPSTLAPAVRELILPKPGAIPGRIAGITRPEPALRAAYLTLPEALPFPEDALAQAQLSAHLAMPAILRGEVDGVTVIKQAGRSCELWVLGPDQPAELDDMVRLIAAREPPAEAIATAVATLFDGEGPPQKGVQVVAQRGGERAELRVLLVHATPEAPLSPGSTYGRRLPPPDSDQGWLGVDPMTDLELTPFHVGEA